MRVLKMEGFGNFVSAAIALALLGLGASGTLAGVLGRRREHLLRADSARVPPQRGGSLRQVFTLAPALLSLTLGIAFRVSEKVSFDPLRILWDAGQLARLALRFSLYIMPFCSGSFFVLSAFGAERAGRAYFTNLAGSAFGVVSLLLALHVFSPGKVFLIPLAFSSCALAFACVGVRTGPRSVVCACALAAAGAALVATGDVSVLPYMARQLALNLPDARVVNRRHTPFGTLEIIESAYLRYAPGLSLAYRGNLPGQLGLYVDGDRLSAIDLGGAGGQAPPDYLRWQIQFAPYVLKAPCGRKTAAGANAGHPRAVEGSPRTLVLGLGGGIGVERALAGCSRDVTVVEQNPRLPPFLLEALRRRGDAPLAASRFTVARGSPRGFLKRASGSWDIIEISFPDSGVSSVGGIYSPHFDYSMTTEAFGEYLSRLAPDGVLSVSVTLQSPPRSLPRVVATAAEAISREGVRDPRDRIVALRSWSTGTVLVKNDPFGGGEIARIGEFCRRNSFDLVYYAGIREAETNIYTILQEDLYFKSVRALVEGDPAFARRYVFDVTPPTDDKPYFFSFLRMKTLPFLFREMGGSWLPMAEGGTVVLAATLAALCLISLLLVGVPAVLHGRGAPGGAGGNRLGILFYFGLIAAGYMFMEIMLVDRLAPVLANPMLSNSAVLASLLVFSGAGSRLSDRLRLGGRSAVLCAVCFVAVYGAGLIAGFGALQQALARIPVFAALPVAVLILSPLAFAMGFPFPAGVRAVRGRDERSLPWAWSVNGCLSVIAAAGAPLVSIGAGLTALGAFAVLCYVLSFFCFPDGRWCLRLRENRVQCGKTHR
jgi:hypothetical protein